MAPGGDRRADVVITDGCEIQALRSPFHGARQRTPGITRVRACQPVVPPLRIDCLKDLIGGAIFGLWRGPILSGSSQPNALPREAGLSVPHAGRSVLSICSAPTQRFILFGTIMNSTRTFLEAFPFAPELRRLGVTQVEIWTRLAREVSENQAD